MSRLPDLPGFLSLLAALRDHPPVDHVEGWPAESMRRLEAAGGLRWNIPSEFGGMGLSGAEMLEVYRELAGACLPTTFILTQRNAACSRMETSSNAPLRSKLLKLLADGAIFSTVGISHLTTSRQHLRTPAVTVSEQSHGNEFVLNGTVPWVTGGPQADVLVTGGTLDDGRQILAAIPADRAGVEVGAPVELMALSCTQTGPVSLRNVVVSSGELLHGPIERVMSSGAGGGAGSLGTSAVAIGTAQGSLMRFADEAARRPELIEYLLPLQHEADLLAQQLRAAAAIPQPAATVTEGVRQRANSLVMRSAQAWLAATKGAGFVAGHPAERAVRQSMFFLVWSCPQPVLAANLQELSSFCTP